MALSAFEREVLTMAVEDWTGLYEVIWSLNTPDSTLTEVEKRSLAQKTIERLVRAGLVYVCRHKHPENWEVVIAADEVDGILGDNQSWQPKTGLTWSVCFAATDEGERVWRIGDPA